MSKTAAEFLVQVDASRARLQGTFRCEQLLLARFSITAPIGLSRPL